MSPFNTDENGDLFVEKLQKDGVIDEAVFSLYINLKNNTSKISLGGYDLEEFGSSEIHFHSINTDSVHWQLNLEKMSLNYPDGSSGSKILGKN